MEMEVSSSKQPFFVAVDNGVSDTQKNMEVKVEDDSNAEDEDFITVQTRKLRCPECPRFSAETAEKMTRHILLAHRGENPFQCFMCDYTTRNKGNFEEHVRRHEGKKPYKCAHCPFRNVSKKNLRNHERIHRPDNPLKCPICDHIAKHKRGLVYHTKTFHSDPEGLTCVKCDSTFDDFDAAKRHKACQKACTECKFLACNDTMLSEHFSSKHSNKKMKPKKVEWVCAICNWGSNKHAKILLHLIHHPNQTVEDIDISILQKHGIM